MFTSGIATTNKFRKDAKVKIWQKQSSTSLVMSILPDQKIVGNSFQPIGGLISGNCIHQGFRQKVTVDAIGQIGNIQFPRILSYDHFNRQIISKLLYISAVVYCIIIIP